MLSQDLFRRTDGFREIVSLAAVFDRDSGAASHGALPWVAEVLNKPAYCRMRALGNSKRGPQPQSSRTSIGRLISPNQESSTIPSVNV